MLAQFTVRWSIAWGAEAAPAGELEGAAGVYLDGEMLFKIRLCF